MRPLDPLRSVKAKITFLLGLTFTVTAAVFVFAANLPVGISVLIALAASMAVVQVVAHGMTAPLREMTTAARAMAKGDHSRRVHTDAQDEVGELARAFNAMAADLEAADKHRRELIANVSHELRTPIAALNAVLENIVDGVIEPDARTMATAQKQTERLGRLVAELLDLSRLDSGTVPLRRCELRVADFLAEVHAQSGIGTGVRIDVLPPDLVAHADPARLHQVVANLLDNAARHSPPDGEIVLRAWETSNSLQPEVVDAGPGIPQSEQDKVFERFTRGGASGGGTGLGLAIARWAVELHGGDICVVGTPPGCRIRVTLPA